MTAESSGDGLVSTRDETPRSDGMAADSMAGNGTPIDGVKKARRWSKFVVRATIFSLLYVMSPVPVGIWCHLATAITPKAVDNVVWITFRTVYAPIQFAYSRNIQVKRFYDNYQGIAEQALLMALSGDDDAA